MLRGITRGLLRLFGWRVEGEIPDHPKMIIIGAPHTSNWDFPLAMLAAGALGLRFRYLGKHTLFRWPFGWFFRMLGGIPVDRTKASGVIAQSAQAFADADRLNMVITPDGTRSKQTMWKSGFYRIARAAQVPVLLVGVDGPGKVIRVGPNEIPPEDVDAYMDRVRAFYDGYLGVRPDNAGAIRLREESDSA